MTHLRKQVRTKVGRDPEPSAAIIDSQSIKTAPVRGQEKGFDGGKKIDGRKRHVLVDTLGLLLAVKVHSAGIVDRCGAKLLLGSLPRCLLPRVAHLFADKGSTGPLLDWIKEHWQWTTEMVPSASNESHQTWVLIDGELVLIRQPKGGFQVPTSALESRTHPGLAHSLSQAFTRLRGLHDQFRSFHPAWLHPAHAFTALSFPVLTGLLRTVSQINCVVAVLNNS
jgi:transposase